MLWKSKKPSDSYTEKYNEGAKKKTRKQQRDSDKRKAVFFL